mmetsp:Transcript_7995/g.17198  ORF Transcript_7995/g.17198 Transcript_7995/m.17198 type:complete len:109 (-) Transcript_7995:416-742(-)
MLFSLLISKRKKSSAERTKDLAATNPRLRLPMRMRMMVVVVKIQKYYHWTNNTNRLVTPQSDFFAARELCDCWQKRELETSKHRMIFEVSRRGQNGAACMRWKIDRMG